MEGLERSILARLGIADPYAGGGEGPTSAARGEPALEGFR
jgi:hypothetical protein